MDLEPSITLVLVTGGSGFIASFCIIALLNAGYRVRATVRALSKVAAITDAMMTNGGVSKSVLTERLEFVVADLCKDEGWDKAVSNCTYILHVASPINSSVPKHENDIIVPAREGTLRVLRAAKAANVKRVVITSSFAAVGYGHRLPPSAPYTEETVCKYGSLGISVPCYDSFRAAEAGRF